MIKSATTKPNTREKDVCNVGKPCPEPLVSAASKYSLTWHFGPS